jgi:hypothetical protein
MDRQSCFWTGPIAIERNALSAWRVDDKLTALKAAQHPAKSHFGERARNLVVFRIERPGDGLLVLNRHDD